MNRAPRLMLIPLLLTYLALGSLYAFHTPPWQVPDEPAHYNYIRALAQEHTLPVIEEGDYDQAYLERITDQADPFPPQMSIEPLTYEDHQPPLYYLLTLPVYLLSHGALLPLRLASVALGLVLLFLVYGLTRTLFPASHWLALAATVLVAFLPQHLAMMAGVNNDALAEVVLGAALWMLIGLIQQPVPNHETRPARSRPGRSIYWSTGIVLGLAVLTKTTVYVVLPVALLAVGLREWRAGQTPPGAPSERWSAARRWLGQTGWLLLTAALVAGPWLARNVAVYGWRDPLALAHHNAVVVGQPRTVQWLTQYGWAGLAGRFVRTTFQSFWGQFGWMGVPLHPAMYLALALFSALVVCGFVGWLVDPRRPRLTSHQRNGLVLLAVSAGLTLAAYLWYNVTFVQHQGRYLFPALIPLALMAALGLEWLLSPSVARWTAIGLAGAGGVWVVWRLLLSWRAASGGLWPGVSVAWVAWHMFLGEGTLLLASTALGLAVLFGLAVLLPRWGRWLGLMALAGGLVALDLYALFGAIVPTLAR